jgi:glycerophosphoryl diester phosphodiesterase
MAFDLQGHRGARGLAPENTLAAFARALEIGVTTLETDLAVTKDGVIVLSHDPVLNPDIVRGPDGQWLAAPGPAINSLTLAELKRYDIGRIKPATKYAQQFAGQMPVDGQRIPTLAELFDLAKVSGKMPRFNIETKLSPEKPDEAPDPETFARLVVEAARGAGLAGRVTIQSFDWRTLMAARRLAPEIDTVCLTYEKTLQDRVDGGTRRPSPWLAGLDPAAHGGSVPRLAAAAGCGTWSPYFRELSPAAVAEAHALDLKVVPWTVNAPDDLARVIDMKVDGLITDYPDRAREAMAAKGIPLP